MRQRTLGQGLTVPVLGLGCMGMSQSYGVPDDQESAGDRYPPEMMARLGQ